MSLGGWGGGGGTTFTSLATILMVKKIQNKINVRQATANKQARVQEQ